MNQACRRKINEDVLPDLQHLCSQFRQKYLQAADSITDLRVTLDPYQDQFQQTRELDMVDGKHSLRFT